MRPAASQYKTLMGKRVHTEFRSGGHQARMELLINSANDIGEVGRTPPQLWERQ